MPISAPATDMTPTLATSCAALPPEGAAAPAAWRSQFRGPGWLEAAQVDVLCLYSLRACAAPVIAFHFHADPLNFPMYNAQPGIAE